MGTPVGFVIKQFSLKKTDVLVPDCYSQVCHLGVSYVSLGKTRSDKERHWKSRSSGSKEEVSDQSVFCAGS